MMKANKAAHEDDKKQKKEKDEYYFLFAQSTRNYAKTQSDSTSALLQNSLISPEKDRECFLKSL